MPRSTTKKKKTAAPKDVAQAGLKGRVKALEEKMAEIEKVATGAAEKAEKVRVAVSTGTMDTL